MISRFRLLHPSRYVPILVVGIAVVMLVPGDTPTSDGEVTPSSSVLAVAATPSAAPREAPVKIADVSRKPPPKDVAVVRSVPKPSAVPPLASPPASAPRSPDPQPVDPAVTAAPAVDEPPPAEAEATSEETTEDAAYQIARVGGSALNVRAGPSSNNRKLFVLRPGEPVRVAGMDGNWARVVRANGDEGWAYARYLTGLHGNAVVETAAAAAPERAERSADEDTKPAAAAAPAPEKPSSAGEERVRYARMGSDVAARAAPSAGAAQLFVLPAGSRVKIAEIRGPWAQVVTDSGVSGWVRFR